MAHARSGVVRRGATPRNFIDGSARVTVKYKRDRDATKSDWVVGAITAAEAERRASARRESLLKADAGRDEWRRNKLAADLAYAHR
jgi:hypothetical protein